MAKYRPEPERFWEKVAKGGPNDCWLWVAAIASSGYGVFSRTGGKTRYYAHRWSYEAVNGPIPDGMQIDHRCRIRACVNPRHLRVVTQSQNAENHSGPTKANSSGHRGVYFETGTQRWVAQLRCQHHFYFERFPTRELAAAAVVEARNRVLTHNDLDRSHG
jgi:hypothetical protein